MNGEQVYGLTSGELEDLERLSTSELQVIAHLLDLSDVCTREEQITAVKQYLADGGSLANFRL
jgi:hypothetical protein